MDVESNVAACPEKAGIGSSVWVVGHTHDIHVPHEELLSAILMNTWSLAQTRVYHSRQGSISARSFRLQKQAFVCTTSKAAWLPPL